MIAHLNSLSSTAVLRTTNSAADIQPFLDAKASSRADSCTRNTSPMNRSNTTNSQPTASLRGQAEPPRPEATMFRRCSLEYTRQNSDKKLGAVASSSSSSDLKASSDANHNLPLGSISASRRRPRRSSLKTSSTSSTGSTASTSTSSSSTISTSKFVTFSLDVNVRPIVPKSEAELKVLWLSKDERQAIQLQANSDLKVLKRIAKIPRDIQTTDPEIRALRNSISIRGLEQFSSKRLHQALWALQHDHLHAVLEAQDVQRELHRRYGHPVRDTELANVSLERSRLSRERATRQGKEDEAAVMGYLGRSARPTCTSSSYTTSSPSGSTNTTTCTTPSPSSSGPASSQHPHRSRSTSQGRRPSQYHRRGSMPTTSTEMERAATRRSSSCSTAAPSSLSYSLSRPAPATGTSSAAPNNNVQRVQSQPGSRTGSLSHGTLRRVQSSVDSLLTRVSSGGNKNTATPGANATFDDVKPPPSSVAPVPVVEDTPLLEPFVYPRPSGSRRNSA